MHKEKERKKIASFKGNLGLKHILYKNMTKITQKIIKSY